MVYNDGMNALMVLVTQLFLGSYVLMLTEFREPARVWKLLWTVVIVSVVGVNIISILFFGFWKYYTRLAVVTVTLPYIIMTVICSRRRGLRVVFNVCTYLWLGCIGNAGGVMVHALLPENAWIHVPVRGLIYLALYFVVRSFEPYYKRMLYLLNYGWGILCVIPLASFLLTLYIINNFLQQAPLHASVILCGIAAVCTLSYVIMYLFFKRVLLENELRNSSRLLDAQIAELEKQSEHRHALKEKMRVQRHDMRHQWATVSALIEQGDKSAVLGYIENVREQLAELSGG